MRSLVLATFVASTLFACSTKDPTTSSDIESARNAQAKKSVSTPAPLAYKVTYLGGLQSGSVSIGADQKGHLQLASLPTGRKGQMLVEIRAADGSLMTGRINNLDVSGQPGKRRLTLDQAASSISSQYCASGSQGRVDAFDGFNDANNLDGRLDGRLGGLNSGLNGGLNSAATSTHAGAETSLPSTATSVSKPTPPSVGPGSMSLDVTLLR